MSSRFEEFDPDNCTKEVMNYIADHIENYLINFSDTAILPDELLDRAEEFEEAKRRCAKAIKKLRTKPPSAIFNLDD